MIPVVALLKWMLNADVGAVGVRVVAAVLLLVLLLSPGVWRMMAHRAWEGVGHA